MLINIIMDFESYTLFSATFHALESSFGLSVASKCFNISELTWVPLITVRFEVLIMVKI